MPAKFGVSCGGDLWKADDIRAVEEFGYDSFWTGEHIVYHRPILESITVLTYAAALTSRIRIGPATMRIEPRHGQMLTPKHDSDATSAKVGRRDDILEREVPDR